MANKPLTTRESIICRKIADLLIDSPINGLVSYYDMNRVAGFDAHKTRRYLLQKAKEIAEEELSAIFLTVTGEGYSRQPGNKADTVGFGARRAIRNKARNASKRMSRVVAASNDLSSSDHHRISAEIATLGIIQASAKDRTVRTIMEKGVPSSYTDVLKATIESIAKREGVD